MSESTRTSEIDLLLLAQSQRNVGDYGVGEKVAPEEAAKLMDWAREFLATARQHLSH